jgi:hypothetical protein
MGGSRRKLYLNGEGGADLVISILILLVSTALLLFYVETFCEQALRHEFSRPYFKEVINAIQLQYPGLRDSYISQNIRVDYSQARLSLKCDFVTLEYLLKNCDPTHGPLSRRERVLIHYFRFVFYSLTVRHAFNLREKEAMLKLATILQFFANSIGEKLSGDALEGVHSGVKS